MGLLSNVLLSPITGPLRGLVWLAGTLHDQADKELYDGDRIRAALLTLEQRLKAGEIDEAEYDTGEQLLLDRLTVARERERMRG
jgi:hypothetical protein